MRDTYHALHRHGANKRFIFSFHFILFSSQKEEKHIDKNIGNILMAVTNHCIKSGCGLVAGKVGSKDFSHYRGRRAAKV